MNCTHWALTIVHLIPHLFDIIVNEVVCPGQVVRMTSSVVSQLFVHLLVLPVAVNWITDWINHDLDWINHVWSVQSREREENRRFAHTTLSDDGQ
jgi:hypothetical protein